MSRIPTEVIYGSVIESYLTSSQPELLAESVPLTDNEARRLWLYLDGLSQIEIARQEGVHPVSVRQSLTSALNSTQRFLRGGKRRFIPNPGGKPHGKEASFRGLGDNLEPEYPEEISAFLASPDPGALAGEIGLTGLEKHRLWDFLDDNPIVAVATVEGVHPQSAKDAVERALHKTRRHLRKFGATTKGGDKDGFTL